MVAMPLPSREHQHAGCRDQHPGTIIVLGTSVTVSLPGIWRSLVMCKSDERLQMVGALLSAHGFSCQELIQEQIAFPMRFRLHMRI